MPLPKGTKEIALVGLLVADIALVYAIVRGTGVEPAGSVSLPTAAATSTPSAASTPVLNNAPSMPVAVVNNDVAWRALPGACAAGGASVSISTDGGATWRSVGSGMRAVTRVSASSPTSGFVVGARAAACRLTVENTDDGGATWVAGGTGTTWRIELSDPTSVFTAAGATVKPCAANAVIALQRTTDAAVTVLCSDGAIRATTDGGARWSAAGSVPGALALGVAGPVGRQRVVVAAAGGDCPGVRVLSRVGSSSATFSAPACVDVGALAAGTPVGVGAGTGDDARPWLFVGAKTWRGSTDLTSWQNVS